MRPTSYTSYLRDTTLGSPRRPDRRVGRRCTRLSLLLPALALLLGGPFAAEPAGAQTVWQATLTVAVDKAPTYYGCDDTWEYLDNCSTALTDNEFDYEGTTYQIRELYHHRDPNASDDDQLDLALDKTFPDGELILTVGGTQFSTSTAAVKWRRGRGWSNAGLSWTDNQQVSVSLTLPPPAPTDLAALPGGGKVTLSWQSPSGSGPGSRYAIEYGKYPNGKLITRLTGGLSSTSPSYVISDLEGDTAYRFRVRKQGTPARGIAHSRWSDWITATPSGVPGAPTGLTVEPVAQTVWQTTLTVDEAPLIYGCDDLTPHLGLDSCSTALTDDEFDYEGTTYRIRNLYHLPHPDHPELDLALDKTFPGGELILTVGGTQFSTSTAAIKWDLGWIWRNAGLSWTDNQQVSVSLTLPPPAPTDLAALPGGGKVTLSWKSPSSSGPGSRYAIEYGEYPNGKRTTRLTGGLSPIGLSYVISDLEGGTAYRFRVRKQGTPARGIAHSRWSDWVAATPSGVPGAPTDLTVESGDLRLALSWTAPSGTVTGYDVHYTSALSTGSGAVADNAPAGGSDASAGWVEVSRTETSPPAASQAISSLARNTAYRIRVRARNTNGAGAWVFGTGRVLAAPSSAGQRLAEPLTASFEQVPAAHDGAKSFRLNVRFSEALGSGGKAPSVSSFAVTGGNAKRVERVEAGLWRVRVKPASWREVTVTLASGGACDEDGAVCAAGGRALSNAVTATVGGPVLIRIEGGKAREGRDESLDFAVTLSRAAAGEVSVDYATEDGTATAGSDYTAASGTLTFAPGETAKTVSVPLLDDAIDEGKETFKLKLSNPRGAYLRGIHRQAKGVIRNEDPLQAMWLARFGRMVASDAVGSVTARLATPRDAGSHVTFAGQRMNFGEAEGGGDAALATVLTGFAQTFGAPSAPAAGEDDPFARHGLTNGWNDPGTVTGARRVTGRELLLGTSFRAVLGQGAGSQWTSWGQGASVSHFSAAVPGLGLTGESATGSMGMDYERGRLLMGFAMTHSVGEGTASDAHWRYALGSTATMALPYARLALSERLSAWGLAGTGSGRLSLDLDGAVPQSYRTDLSMTLAATGVRGDLVTPAEPGGFALALKADAFWVRTESDRVTASEFGNLAAARGDSSRVRAVLDGSRTFSLAGGATLAPSVELGVRRDGGDAETGTGLEFGAGLGYADPSRGLDMALRVHGLAVHSQDGYDEWGVSGQLRLVPGGSGRGLSASLTPSFGVDPGGSQRLWALPQSTGLASNGEAAPSSRLDTELGYGLPVFGGGFTGTPNVGFGLSGDGARDLRVGWRLTPVAASGDTGFEVSVDATRREAAGDDTEHGVMLRSLVRW